MKATQMRLRSLRATLVVMAVAGCFNPDPPAGRPCGPDGWCPAPLTCIANVCGGTDPTGDGGGDGNTSGPHNLAFLSDPIELTGNKSLADLDAHCAMGAPPGTYVAWYSSDDGNASARLGSKHGWKRPDGQPFANKLSDLLAGIIFTPLRLDKAGSPVAGEVLVATATRPDGGWTGRSCLGNGTGPLDLGVGDGTTGTWTDIESSVACSNTVRLYCLQVDHANDVPLPTTTGRIVFITRGTIDGGLGVQAMDSLCTTEAGAPARALVATTGSSARSKLPTGMPLVRPDGIRAFDDALNRIAPINVTFDGKMYLNASVWTGARGFGDTGTTETCMDWTDETGGTLARTGTSSRSLDASFGGLTPVSCYPGLGLRVYCVVL